MKKSIYILNILVALLVCQDIFADEGMWMINDINRALEKKMQERGLKLSANEIYNADAEGASLSDAIVSLDFGCTGSIISDQGLIITNHHCAYSDVHALSTPEHNLLEEGFWARNYLDERPIAGKNAFLLKKVIDVTEEASKILDRERKCNRPCGSRRLSSLIEKKWSKETGMTAWLYSMWKGSKYYIALYEVYTDVRLVAAPPVSMAAFGGDIDNWEWPQHKCDFAMYRIYTGPDGRPAEYSEENVPMNSLEHLRISTKGYQEGDFTMILGYPGRTNRNSGADEAAFEVEVKLPVCNGIRASQMKIMNNWMNRDEHIRLQYADHYFSLSNVQELQAGEVQCSRRFKVVESKRKRDERLQEWIMSDPQRALQWGGLLKAIKDKYEATREIERNINYFRETLVRGVYFNRVIFKFNALRNEMLKANGVIPKKKFELVDGPDPIEKEMCSTISFSAMELGKGISWGERILKEYEGFDLRVEEELFHYALEQYYSHVDPKYWGPYQKELHDRYTSVTLREGKPDIASFNARALSDWIWENSIISHLDKMSTFLGEEHTIDEYYADPMYRFFEDIKVTVFTSELQDVEGNPDLLHLKKEYAHALHQMKQDLQLMDYPDANSSMRITYGTVGGLEPWDAVMTHWQSTTQGILEKYDPKQYEFRLDDTQLELYRNKDWGRWGWNGSMPVNFLTDNDITGGNSGSPVLNAEGELIGLAFDGNKESLASELSCVDGYNKCVCVDIRYVLWTLDQYAHLDRILEEIGME